MKNNKSHAGTGKSSLKLEFFTKIINTLPDPIFVKDSQHHWLILNDALCDFIGLSRQELIGKTDHDIFPKEQADVFWHKDDEVFRTGRDNINEEHITDANGIDHIISTKKAIFMEQETGETFLVGTIRDVTELRKTEEKLKKAVDELSIISNTDPLTHLYNRRYLLSIAEHQIKIAKRNDQVVSLIFADMNKMKQINDQYGHIEGDKAIVEIANILESTFRDSDVIARIGGDEFVVLAFGKNMESGQLAIQRFNDALDKRNLSSEKEYSLSVSIGFIDSKPDEQTTILELIDHADQEMYKEKSKIK